MHFKKFHHDNNQFDNLFSYAVMFKLAIITNTKYENLITLSNNLTNSFVAIFYLIALLYAKFNQYSFIIVKEI